LAIDDTVYTLGRSGHAVYGYSELPISPGRTRQG